MDLIKEKKALLGALTGLAGVAIVVLLYIMFWGVLEPQEQFPARNISVSATGKAVAKPDIAVTSFSVVSEGTDIKAISDQNNETIGKAVSFLKEKGIDEKDIQTVEYNLSPVYSQKTYAPSAILSTPSVNMRTQPVSAPVIETTTAPTIVKYSLTQTVRVKIRDFTKTSEIIGALAPMGINKVSQISFGIDDPEVYRAQARAEAIEKAKAKAQVMAQQLGVSLGHLVSISEYAQDSGYQPMMSAVKSMGGYSEIAAPVAPSIEAGSQEVVVNANITYEIK